MQAHTSGEVGILGTVLLRVYSGTTFAIFVEIGLYLTEKEQKISWHSFFETWYSNTHTSFNDHIRGKSGLVGFPLGKQGFLRARSFYKPYGLPVAYPTASKH